MVRVCKIGGHMRLFGILLLLILFFGCAMPGAPPLAQPPSVPAGQSSATHLEAQTNLSTENKSEVKLIMNETIEVTPNHAENRSEQPTINKTPEKLIEQPKCLDSDEKDFFTKGEVKAQGRGYTDVCTSPETVKEFYCQDEQVQDLIKNCPVGSKCEDGKCNKFEPICNDSDGGLNESYYGEVIFEESSGITYNYTDGCKDLYTLTEYYCEGNIAKSQIVACIPNRGEQCLRGACQKPKECGDTDSGINSFVPGIVKVVDKTIDATPREFTYEDYCSDNTTLIEYYCDEYETAVFQNISCTNNCDNASC